MAGKIVIRESYLSKIRPLELIEDNYPKYVLSMDEVNRGRNGVIHKNIRDWLLNR